MSSEDKGIVLTGELRDYLVDHSIPIIDAQRGIIADTLSSATASGLSIMQIPREQGSFMTLLTRLIGARVAVEVGTFTGYSALSIALGLPADGRLMCFDVSDEWPAIGRPHWQGAGVGDRITVTVGPAAETLAQLPDDLVIDLVFLDADKGGYLGYFEELLPRVRPGGMIVADNVLANGDIVDASSDQSNVVALRQFNDAVAADDRVDVVMVNIADGLSLIRKR
jgi:caffeoyl-CoA O-methyltransferase